MKKSLLSMILLGSIAMGVSTTTLAESCLDKANTILDDGDYAADYSGSGAIISSEYGGMISTRCSSGATSYFHCRSSGSVSSKSCSETDSEIVLTMYDMVGQNATLHLPKGTIAPHSIKASIGGRYANFSADFRRI